MLWINKPWYESNFVMAVLWVIIHHLVYFCYYCLKCIPLIIRKHAYDLTFDVHNWYWLDPLIPIRKFTFPWRIFYSKETIFKHKYLFSSNINLNYNPVILHPPRTQQCVLIYFYPSLYWRPTVFQVHGFLVTEISIWDTSRQMDLMVHSFSQIFLFTTAVSF